MIHIGIHGHVLALDRTTGVEIWRTKLKGDVVNLALEEGDLYATTSGEIYCLDPATGQIRWHNLLKGLGRGLVTIATSSDQQTLVIQQKAQDDAAASAASSAAM